MPNRLIEFLKDESGATAIEYAVLMLLIGVAAISAFAATGDSLQASYQNTADQFPE